MSFQLKPTRKKEKEEKRKKPSCLPSPFSHRLLQSTEAGLVTLETGCLPPTFAGICPPLRLPSFCPFALLPSPPRHSSLWPLVYCQDELRSVDEYSGAEGCWWDESALPELAAGHCHAEKCSTAHTKMPFICPKWMGNTDRVLPTCANACWPYNSVSLMIEKDPLWHVHH